ncbi:MAG TPA: MarR family transcriptional regulator [Chitinophagaceae bacterium]|nr:MarR family transcriptional regulator [Chitinophagaceae bacterium]
MGIEKDISQSKFRNEYQKATINLIYTYNWMNERIKNMLDQYDITPQQFNILRILRGAGKPISTLQIRQRMLDKMSDTSRIVDRLLKKDLVRKVVCEGDRRLVDVTISENGLALLQRIDSHQDDMDGVFKNLDEQQAITLNNLLDKIRSNE